MRKLIILLLLIAGACYGQQNATFNNLDIRNTTKLRGIIYPFGAVATSPINPAVHEVLMVNNSTFATCRMDFAEFADSIANHITVGGYWTEDNPDTIYTDYNVRVDSSFRMVYKDRYFGDISDYDFLGSMIYNDSIYCYNMLEDQGNGFWNVEMGGQTYNTNRTSDIIIQDAIISIETLAPSHSSSIVIDTNELHIDSDSIVMTGGKVRIDGDLTVTSIDSLPQTYQMYYNKATGDVTYDLAGAGTGANLWYLSGDTARTDYGVRISDYNRLDSTMYIFHNDSLLFSVVRAGRSMVTAANADTMSVRADNSCEEATIEITPHNIRLFQNGDPCNPGGNITITAPEVNINGLTNLTSTTSYESPTLGTELTDGTGWTSAGWTGNYATGFTHTAGNTSSLNRAVTIDSAGLYAVTFTISSRTAGQIYVMIGGASSTGGANHKFPDAPDGAYPTTVYTFGILTTDDISPLMFVPGSTFDGKISNISVKEITAPYNPVITLENSSGDNVLEIRSKGGLNAGSMFIGKDAGKYSVLNNPDANNTGIGYQSMLSNTSGWNNTGLGYISLSSNTTGLGNTAIGAYTLQYNVSGDQNTAVGAAALEFNTSGIDNFAGGVECLKNNTTGSYNVAVAGYDAMHYNSTGSRNVAVGHAASLLNTIGDDNTAIGGLSLYNNTATGNTAVGAYSGYTNTSGTKITAIGYYALSLSTGSNNTALGYSALKNNSTGASNTAVGTDALITNSTGSYNTAVGHNALQTSNTTYNTAVGYNSLISAVGDYNTAVGGLSGNGLSDGYRNTYLGYGAGYSNVSGTNNICIGFSAGQYITGSKKLVIDVESKGSYANDTTQSLIFGNFATDHLTINGDITYGDTFWDDLSVPATQARIGATSKPAYAYDTLGLLWDNTPVDTTNQLVVLNYQIPHRWKDGTSIYLHVHYHQSSAADTCEWFKAQYKLTDRGENRDPAYTTIKTNNQTEYTYTSGSLHQIATFPAISTAGHTESCMLQIVLYCYSIADLYTYDMDVHFEIDKPGSDNQTP